MVRSMRESPTHHVSMGANFQRKSTVIGESCLSASPPMSGAERPMRATTAISQPISGSVPLWMKQPSWNQTTSHMSVLSLQVPNEMRTFTQARDSARESLFPSGKNYPSQKNRPPPSPFSCKQRLRNNDRVQTEYSSVTVRSFAAGKKRQNLRGFFFLRCNLIHTGLVLRHIRPLQTNHTRTQRRCCCPSVTAGMKQLSSNMFNEETVEDYE